ncbi:MAG: hypothetical protein C0503_05965 [Gemmatimonas sp.]|nr:hypothetical protein [Gemmatimonas sp.]
MLDFIIEPSVPRPIVHLACAIAFLHSLATDGLGQVVARRAEAAIVVDGRLGRDEWGSASVVTGFVQASPEPGRPASQASSAQVLFDDLAIYVALRLTDLAPDSIVAPLARRDFTGYSDWAHVIIDSYQDRRTAFRFALNPAGVKRDGYISGDSEATEDLGWDAVWDGAVSRDATGWTAEFRIPLSQLRFDTSRDVAEWGIQFGRDIARRAERSHWTLITPAQGGYVSRFGTLRGLRPPARLRRLELMPFTLGTVTHAPVEVGNPFFRQDRVARSAGLDLRAGLTSDLTVSATLLPDFGQVEADPALVNLSGVEVGFAERRPFFVEGGDLFQQNIAAQDWVVGRDQLFYSRRIGRSVQGSPPADAQFAERVDATRLLGALKLSGKTRDGWSIGALSATTEETRARFVDAAGLPGSTVVEPMTHYGVLRVARDIDGGEGTVGLFATSTHRRLADTPLTSLRSGALVGGVTLRQRFASARWQVEAALVGSEVRGSAVAIAATQRSITRLYQRADAAHLRVDSSSTALRGIGSSVTVAKVAGGVLRGGIAGGLKTPGFEPNDLGLMARADVVHGGAWLGLESFALATRTRARALWLNTWYQTTTAGERTLRGARLWGRVQLRNFHALASEVGLDGSALGVHVLRGGPALMLPTRLSHSVRYTSDTRRPISLSVGHFYLRALQADGFVHTLTPDVTLRPSARAEGTLGTMLSRNRLPWQFVGLARAADGVQRSVVGDLHQRQAALTARVNYAFTPNLSLQLYAQPFVAAGRIAGFDEVVDPRAARWSARVRRYEAADVQRLADGRVRLGSGTAAVTMQDPSFARAQLRGNAVLRWEYRPSSTLFVVWSQMRDHTGDPSVQSLDVHGADLWARTATNLLTVKWTHYLGS